MHAHRAQVRARFSIGALLFTLLPLACDGNPQGSGTPVASVAVIPSEAPVQVGGTVQLAAEPRNGDGTPLAGRDVAWSSGDETVATVDQTKLVTGVGAGTVTITATSEGVDRTATITVEEPPPPPGNLTCGDLISDAIEATAEVDVFTFDGSAGNVVLLTVGETGGFSGSLSNARVRLLSPTRVEVTPFNTNGGVQPELRTPASAGAGARKSELRGFAFGWHRQRG